VLLFKLRQLLAQLMGTQQPFYDKILRSGPLAIQLGGLTESYFGLTFRVAMHCFTLRFYHAVWANPQCSFVSSVNLIVHRP
jgi:hypothetical protein